MTYRDEQKKKTDALLKYIGDKGSGVFTGNGKTYPFILQDAKKNLFDDIRDDAIAYFRDNHIPWWNETGETEKGPTGHLFSSQVSCVNHLFLLRDNKDFATAVLQNIDSRIESATTFTYPDNSAGYVAFEVIGRENYLGERQHSRGANATSIDTFMIGKKRDGKNVLFPIEWKYTEYYETGNSLFIPARKDIYNKLLEQPDSPVKIDFQQAAKGPFEPLYYEPFYQLMRQTLLAWQMVLARENDSDEYIHLHVVPKENSELRGRNPSPELSGADMESAWKGVLKEPQRYHLISPQELLAPLQNEQTIQSLWGYLEKRYWS